MSFPLAIGQPFHPAVPAGVCISPHGQISGGTWGRRFSSCFSPALTPQCPLYWARASRTSGSFWDLALPTPPPASPPSPHPTLPNPGRLYNGPWRLQANGFKEPGRALLTAPSGSLGTELKISPLFHVPPVSRLREEGPRGMPCLHPRAHLPRAFPPRFPWVGSWDTPAGRGSKPSSGGLCLSGCPSRATVPLCLRTTSHLSSDSLSQLQPPHSSHTVSSGPLPASQASLLRLAPLFLPCWGGTIRVTGSCLGGDGLSP